MASALAAAKGLIRTYLSDEASAVRVGPSPFANLNSNNRTGSERADTGKPPKMQRDGEIGNIYHLFEKKGGVPSQKTDADPFPQVKWVSVANQTRVADDALEDKAASYLPQQNTLLINADFRVFTDMASRLIKDKDAPASTGLQEAITEIVHQWFEQSLIETIIGIQQLRGSKEWGPEQVQRALSTEALTSAVMQRYHVYIACRRELGARFGKLAAAQ